MKLIGSVISLSTFLHLLFLDISCYEMCSYHLLHSEYTGPVVPLPSQKPIMSSNFRHSLIILVAALTQREVEVAENNISS